MKQIDQMRLQLSAKTMNYQFPVTPGTYECSVWVEKGSVDFHHKSYEMYSGMWIDETPMETPRHRLIGADEKCTFYFTVSVHGNEPDQVSLTNHSYTERTELVLSLRQLSQSDESVQLRKLSDGTVLWNNSEILTLDELVCKLQDK